MSKKRERKIRMKRQVRRERLETRIKRDIKGFIGYDFLQKLVDRSERPDAIMGIFLTGARATELLDMTRGHISDIGPYYEVRALPVYKKYDVIGSWVDDRGKKHWVTELRMETRTFPILKSNPFAEPFWKLIKDREGKLFEFKIPASDELWDDQYWQLYKHVARVELPQHPMAPKYHKGENRGQQKNVYPHWLRGQRAVQLRVEYGLTADDLMSFFRWNSFEMALYYASLSSVDLADTMIRGRDRIRKVMGA